MTPNQVALQLLKPFGLVLCARDAADVKGYVFTGSDEHLFWLAGVG